MLLLGSSKFTLTKTTTGVTAYAHSPAGIWKSGTLQRAPGVRSVRPLCPPFLAQAWLAGCCLALQVRSRQCFAARAVRSNDERSRRGAMTVV
jgi:hypothetical protein